MTNMKFPKLDEHASVDTRDAIRAYSQVLENVQQAARAEPKNSSHTALQLSLNGISTGVMRSSVSYEIELDLRASQLVVRASTGERFTQTLSGQPAFTLSDIVVDFLVSVGVDKKLVPALDQSIESTGRFQEYADEQSNVVISTLNTVAYTLELLKSSLPEETSAVQLWVQRFDLSMMWLSGEKVCEPHPSNEVNSDKQMNFGFSFGDSYIPEPYFFATAYPMPDVMSGIRLPHGAKWHSNSYRAAVLPYETLRCGSSPVDVLLDLWISLADIGRRYLVDREC